MVACSRWCTLQQFLEEVWSVDVDHAGSKDEDNSPGEDRIVIHDGQEVGSSGRKRGCCCSLGWMARIISMCSRLLIADEKEEMACSCRLRGIWFKSNERSTVTVSNEGVASLPVRRTCF